MAKNNPIDAVGNAASGAVQATKGAFNSVTGIGSSLLKAGMFVGGLVGVFAIVGALTSPAGLAALAPHVNMAFEGFNAAVSGLSTGASWVGAKLSGVHVAAPAMGL